MCRLWQRGREGGELHFHHVKPTGLRGEGRGQNERASDVMHNLDSYVLLCPECHKKRHKEMKENELND